MKKSLAIAVILAGAFGLFGLNARAADLPEGDFKLTGPRLVSPGPGDATFTSAYNDFFLNTLASADLKFMGGKFLEQGLAEINFTSTLEQNWTGSCSYNISGEMDANTGKISGRLLLNCTENSV